MSKGTQRRITQLFSRFVKDVLVVITGTVVSFGLFHLATMQIIRQYRGILEMEHFYRVYFTLQMLPAALGFAFMVAVIYYLYRKTRKMMLALAEGEARAHREEAMVSTLQRITALMAASSARENSTIMEWAESRRKKGQEPPRRVTEASARIAMALQALSHLSFIMPYRAREGTDLEAYAELLEKRLRVISTTPAALLEHRADN